MRKRLMDILSRELPVVGDALGGRIVSYRLPDDTVVRLTADDGMPETISLRSEPWKQLDFVEPTLRIKLDKEKRYAVFCTTDGEMVKYESVLKVPLGEALELDDKLKAYPKILPDSNRLDLNYAIDCILPQRPYLWIE